MDDGACEFILHEAVRTEICQLQGAGRDQPSTVSWKANLLVLFDEEHFESLGSDVTRHRRTTGARADDNDVVLIVVFHGGLCAPLSGCLVTEQDQRRVAGLLSHLWMRIVVFYLIAAVAASVAGSRP